MSRRPPSPEQLRGRFPETVFLAGATAYRSHAAQRGPWWFSNNGGGRFDLSGPEGTCYTAEAALITLLEAWSGIGVIPRPELAGRDISEVSVRRDLRLADATSNRAIQFGVTSELFTTTDYALTQQWAQALRDAGFDGIRYWARHDLRHVHACLAVFAASGDRTGTVLEPTDFTVLGTENLLDRPDLWDALEDETGIVVLDIPGSL
ncbi:RES family NAD+ phosphorylase [Rhodococcus sp. NPDC047139]|uniref:RES family NAD+ phosphorylase n=1 Tax=Rhodococcus sp. NPDC047139 TaxID=3155141 RepID=UPI0033DC3E4A